jgi:hypothetical protein
MTAAEMTDFLTQINDRLATAARRAGGETITFFCECGDCLAEDVSLSLDDYEEIRAREDLIFAPGHDAPRRYRQHSLVSGRSTSSDSRDRLDGAEWWRDSLIESLIRIVPHGERTLKRAR